MLPPLPIQSSISNLPPRPHPKSTQTIHHPSSAMPIPHHPLSSAPPLPPFYSPLSFLPFFFRLFFPAACFLSSLLLSGMLPLRPRPRRRHLLYAPLTLPRLLVAHTPPSLLVVTAPWGTQHDRLLQFQRQTLERTASPLRSLGRVVAVGGDRPGGPRGRGGRLKSRSWPRSRRKGSGAAVSRVDGAGLHERRRLRRGESRRTRGGRWTRAARTTSCQTTRSGSTGGGSTRDRGRRRGSTSRGSKGRSRPRTKGSSTAAAQQGVSVATLRRRHGRVPRRANVRRLDAVTCRRELLGWRVTQRGIQRSGGKRGPDLSSPGELGGHGDGRAREVGGAGVEDGDGGGLGHCREVILAPCCLPKRYVGGGQAGR